jgi:predicted nucleic acid-binding protein
VVLILNLRSPLKSKLNANLNGSLRLNLIASLLEFCQSTRDAVQIACASVQGLDAIVTRDAELFTTLVPLLSVSQVLQQLETFE